MVAKPPASILDLPVELLIIFTLYLESSLLSPSYHRTILRLVTKRWRNVCDDTPSIWTRIDLDDASISNSTALIRSRRYPLHVAYISTATDPARLGRPC